MIYWTVVSTLLNRKRYNWHYTMALFRSLDDAMEYAAFVTDFDEERFPGWITYVVEGDFLNV
jgi:hypothetical protein